MQHTFAKFEHTFYKYRAINKNFIDSFVKSALYFAEPNALNDPYDCQMDFSKACYELADKLSNDRSNAFIALAENKDIIEKQKKAISQLGVCSFSRVNDETLLWSHYADEHKGVCVEYQFPKDFLMDEANIRKFMGVASVAYVDNPLRNWLETITTAQLEDLHVFYNELTNVLLTYKSPPWKYENEMRIVRFESGLVTIPMSFVKHIYFGLQASESDIDLVITIAKAIGYSCNYSRAIRSDGDYGFKFIKI